MSKNPRIRPLDDHVINQIAAGEVVERPASIVKELVENSLDAGATRITIELDEGGIERILLRDDGNGIPADQLDLALSRHCTSKLVESSELQSIASLGFRGEALATIAAVGELSCISRTAADSHGWRTDAQPGRDLTRPTPEAHPIGTTIVVRDLFANVPARRRFLKQPRTEYLHCQQFVRRAGFCYPGVSFTLFHDGRQTLSLPGCEDERAGSRRWQSLFGADFMRAAMYAGMQSKIPTCHFLLYHAAGPSRHFNDISDPVEGELRRETANQVLWDVRMTGDINPPGALDI